MLKAINNGSDSSSGSSDGDSGDKDEDADDDDGGGGVHGRGCARGHVPAQHAREQQQAGRGPEGPQQRQSVRGAGADLYP